MGALKELAEEMRAAVITVMHFNKKVISLSIIARFEQHVLCQLSRHAYGVIKDA